MTDFKPTKSYIINYEGREKIEEYKDTAINAILDLLNCAKGIGAEYHYFTMAIRAVESAVGEMRYDLMQEGKTWYEEEKEENEIR